MSCVNTVIECFYEARHLHTYFEIIMNIEVYTKGYCPYCHRAKSLLSKLEAEYKEIAIDGDLKLREEMIERSGRKTVPQIFINDQHIGGFDDMYALHKKGDLKPLLELP